MQDTDDEHNGTHSHVHGTPTLHCSGLGYERHVHRRPHTHSTQTRDTSTLGTPGRNTNTAQQEKEQTTMGIFERNKANKRKKLIKRTMKSTVTTQSTLGTPKQTHHTLVIQILVSFSQFH